MTKPIDPLDDPRRRTISIPEAATIIGVAKSTAYNVVKATGFLMPGVPVLRIGKRQVVSTAQLRAALGVLDGSALEPISE